MLWMAVLQRDRSCRFPRIRKWIQTTSCCGRGTNLEIHHILPRGRGGTHAMTNLVTLCHLHHQDPLVHSLDWSKFDTATGTWTCEVGLV
jgi:hypothetical protein